MTDWFSALSGFEKTYWIFAALGSLLFVFVLISTFIGGDTDELGGDVDADVEADTGIGFQFFTFKNLVAFFTIFGWSGIACIDAGMSTGITILVSVISGMAMMFVMGFLMYQINKLVSSGTLQMKNAIGLIGEVYLTVGAKRSNIGKVQITVQGTLRELEALTQSDTDLTTGTVIKVKDVTESGILIVEQVNE